MPKAHVSLALSGVCQWSLMYPEKSRDANRQGGNMGRKVPQASITLADGGDREHSGGSKYKIEIFLLPKTCADSMT